MTLYGTIPGTTITRLLNSVNPGDTVITVENNIGWAIGDSLVISASEF